jgi:hypothetical protein
MSDAVKEAQRLFTEAMEAVSDQRRQIEEDLLFSDPAKPDQWDQEIKRQREHDPGGIRPCLVFDQLGQYVSNVAGQIQQRPPSLHALPVDGGADRKVAEQLDGFFRHIEHASRAQQHYATALLSAARTGVGYLVVRPEYTNRALNYQEPRISVQGDPLKVVFDPWSVELDGSDATFGFLLQLMSPREFERRYGEKAEKRSFGDDGTTQKDNRESILVAEQWVSENEIAQMIVCVDLSRDPNDEFVLSEAEFMEKAQDVNSPLRPVFDDKGNPRIYKDKRTVVKWSRMSGAEVLDKETVYPAEGIGIVPVYGYVGLSGGRLTYCGMPRRAMNAQRSYNYHMSEMHVFMGQAPKAPWVVPMRALGGDESLKELWDKASSQSRAYLPYHDIDEQGAIQAPSRTPLGVNLQNHIAGAQQALQDIQAALGMYQANLGAPSNETSGVAIDSRKEQGEASTANFPMNLQASVAQVGKLCMQMLPKLIDTKRQLRILGIDERPSTITIDPQQENPLEETPQGLSINPNIGQYDVRVVVGASYTTQRTQAQQALNEVMARNPEMAPAVAPLWAQTLDIPYADKLAQALIAVAPAPVKAVLQPEAEQEGPSTAELAAKVEQMRAAIQEATAIAQEAEQELAEAQAKLADKSNENEIAQFNAQTQRLKVTGANEEQIKAIVFELVNQMLTSPAPLGDEDPQGGEIADPYAGEQIPAPEAMEMPPEQPMEPI